MIRAVDFLEHVADKVALFNEVYRLLAPGGLLLSQTPSTDGRGAFQDPTHCLDPATRVLMADLTWRQLGDVHTGDVLLGLDEHGRMGPAGSNKRRLLPTTVEACCAIRKDALRIVLEDGREIVASADHRFLWRGHASNTYWRTAGELQAGELLRQVIPPWGSSSYEDGWIGGMLDGEGSLRTRTDAQGQTTRAAPGGGTAVSIAQKHGPVYGRVVAYLRARDYHFTETEQRHAEVWRLNPGVVGRVNVSRTSEILRLLGQACPTRFPHDWWHGSYLSGSNGDGWIRIAAIEPIGERELIDIQTTTHTFIAEGLVTHNCAFYNEHSFWYYTDPRYQAYVPEVIARFQVSRLVTYFPTEWHEQNQIPYVCANLIALKDGAPRNGGLT